MPKAKVKWNFAQAGEILLRGPEIEADMKARGEAVLQEAQATSPFKEGDYEESLWTTTDDDGTRVKALVLTDSEYGQVVQVRTNHLAKALKAAGGNSQIK